MTFQPDFTITSPITRALTRIERARGFLEAATLSEDWLRRIGEEALVREAHHTTHIEGTRLTLEESERLWHGEGVPGADPDDARELLNYRAAFDLVSDHVAEGGPIAESLIREIHRRLVEGVRGGSADPGAYRKIQNYVVNSATGEVVYEPPPRAIERVFETERLTIEEFEGLCPDVSRRTLQRDLKGLIDAGLLVARGEADIRHYVAAQPLA